MTIEIYFHKDKKKCDFIIKNKHAIETAIQVCARLDNDEIKKREYVGLLEAMQAYSLSEGFVLTESTEALEEITIDNRYKINVIPIWKWLLDIPK